jgi:hypothetical protein
LKTENSAEDSGQHPYASTWAELIGPEYAAALRPIRKFVVVGGVGILVSLAAEIIWMSRVGTALRPIDILGGFAFDVPGLATLGIGLVLQTRLSSKINYDLWAVGVVPANVEPDLRNPSRFLYWSRRYDVTPEQVQEAGKRAAALRSAPNDQGLWDFTSKKRGGGGRADPK